MAASPTVFCSVVNKPHETIVAPTSCADVRKYPDVHEPKVTLSICMTAEGIAVTPLVSEGSKLTLTLNVVTYLM